MSTFVACNDDEEPMFLFESPTLYSAQQRLAIFADDETWKNVKYVRPAKPHEHNELEYR